MAVAESPPSLPHRSNWHLSSRQLPLPLGPPVPLVPPVPAPPAVEVVVPQQVWPRLAPPARARVRQTFTRVLQEVLDDRNRDRRDDRPAPAQRREDYRSSP